MFLSKIYNKKSGRTFLQIVESYREHGKPRQWKVKPLCYLDEFEQEFDDPISSSSQYFL